MYFEDSIDEQKYCGHLFGLGTSLFTNGIPYDAYIPPQALQHPPQGSTSQTSLAGHNPASTSAMHNGGVLNIMNSNSITNNSASAPNLTNLVPNGDSK